jgi:hypothetical protein
VLAIVKNNLGQEYKQVKNAFYKFYDNFFHLIEVQFLRIGPQEKSMTIYFGVSTNAMSIIFTKTPMLLNYFIKGRQFTRYRAY